MKNFYNFFTSSIGIFTGITLGFYLLSEFEDYYDHKLKQKRR